MTNKRETIRQAVAESLDYGFSEAVFTAADNIADAILDDGQTDASEIADGLVEIYTRELLTQWLGLNAQGAASSEGLATPTTDALELIRVDVFVVLERAASAALNVAGDDDDE